MMTLDVNFSRQLDQCLQDCAAQGVILSKLMGVRDPVTQAKLWRQSRPTDLIEHVRDNLRSEGADFLAQCLDEAGPQPSGPEVTRALPGYSWHQWGLAQDVVWMVNDSPEWSLSKLGPLNGYLVLARMAKKYGLTTLIAMGDAGHVQLPSAAAPDRMYPLAVINNTMKRLFS